MFRRDPATIRSLCRFSSGAMLLAAVGLGLSAAGPGVAAEPDSAAEVVAGVKATYKDVRSIHADFTQTVSSPTMGSTGPQKGTITLARPRKLRVEVGSPLESAMVSDGTTLWMYSVASKSVTESAVSGQDGEVDGLLDDLSQLDTLFSVALVPDATPRPTQTVTLTPRKPGAISSIRLTLTRANFAVTDLVLLDPFATVTTMNFSNFKLNATVADSMFAFAPPAGVQVIRGGGP